MRGKNPRHDMNMVHQVDRGAPLLGIAGGIHPRNLSRELIIRPGLIDKQALQQGLGAHVPAHLRW
ncbi:hypothetical protein [Mesorhizobium sp. B2-8-5]|uniref:hypothetical protein n=1 Tax=Mesorhizobium sp. B2-8-5 TaxID=2589903 RepID=UPI001D02AD50|nr:hypothetical protein [Mesorhizobium sp. B2-8-5]UCI29210.1 hypothetical protein FJ430_26190 [Mesorhizobium sp. B2-8-5]